MSQQCPKCGSGRFLFDARFQSYICRSCKYCDSSILLPSEQGDYAKFIKFLNHAIKHGDFALKQEKAKEFTYDDFKFFISKFLKENQEQNQEVENKPTPKKKTRKKKS